ncbi:hypothetical protein ACIP02_22695 [Pseudomonas sp. NPDC089408]|uniref:hypothetical protein n=1 Tax=Pseudomonas sp. NPDC089408 TaxID=3364465 RepID=UPI0038120C00
MMTDLSKQDIVKRLAGGSVMRRWGAIAAWARDQLNLLLRDQYLQGYTSHSFIEPMSKQFDLDEGGELRGEFRNLVLGPPQLSFEDANMLSAVTTVRMKILSAEYVQYAYLPGSPPILLRAMSVDEGMDHAVSAQVALKLQGSASGQFTQLVLALSDARADSLECELGTTPYTSRQIGKAVFSHWVEQPGYRQVYVLAQFDREDYASMSPMGIKVLTQMAPWGGRTNKAFKDKAASEGDGAVVLMMQLRSHMLPGTLPQLGDDFPYLIPGTAATGAEHSSTLLLDPVNEGKPAEPLSQVLRPVRMPNAHRYTYSESDKFVPADVVGFGQISPTEGTYRVDPATSSIVAKGTLPFKLEGRTPVKTWATANLTRASASGAITPTGVYSARDADAFTADSQVSLVTGHYVDGSGSEHSRSALVVERVRPVEVSPRVMVTSANEVPILLSASSEAGGTLRWELIDASAAQRTLQGPQRTGNPGKHDLASAYRADLGKLEDLGNGQARFTPQKIAPGKPEILFQTIRATDTQSQVFADATVVIVTWPQRFAVEPFYVADYKPNATVPFTVKDIPAGLTWHLFGEGTIDKDGTYTPPQAAKSPVTVVMADVNDLYSGYAIIEHRPVVQARPANVVWDDLLVFSIELVSAGKCYANGMQQIEVKVTIETKIDGPGIAPPISDAELASLKLFNVEGGKVLEFLPAGEEGLEPGGEANWAVSLDRNRVGTRPANLQGEARGEESTRRKHLFLMSTTVGTLEVAAQFTSDDRVVYRSTSYNQGISKVTVVAEPVPIFATDAYTFNRVPVKGWENQGNEDFDKVDDTTDYWVLAGAKGDDFQTLKFLRLKFEDESQVSMIRWESDQRKEKYCSFTGYAFTPFVRAGARLAEGTDNPEDPEKYLVHDGLLQALVKQQKAISDYLDTELVDSHKPGAGDVCFALHRVSDLPLFYDKDQANDKKWRSALERPLSFRLMDQNGNWHRLRVSFHLASGIKGSRDKLTFNLM